MATSTRPPVARQSSHVPGGFDDDDLSPIKSNSEDEGDHFSEIPSAPTEGSASMEHVDRSEELDNSLAGHENDTFLQEKEMRRKLEDYDSTFLQALSPVVPEKASDTDSGPPRIFSRDAGVSEGGLGSHRPDIKSGASQEHLTTSRESPAPSVTPPDLYRTPAPERQEEERDRPKTAINDHYNTSSLETMSSSPTAAAAARTISRAVSGASTDYGYDTADDSKGGIALQHESTPRRDRAESTASHDTATPSRPEVSHTESENKNDQKSSLNIRPQYLSARMASNHSAFSSYTTVSTDDGSDATLGADFALQTGGAVPERASLLAHRPTDFSRSISLGSMASGISGTSEDENISKPSERFLQTLNEEETPKLKRLDTGVPQTPASPSNTVGTPTDTIIAQRAKDVEVPATLAREYRSRQRLPSPEKRNGGPISSVARNGKTLTLKEQSGTIDRLVKENFDLKLKITFLDEALNRRSEEGVKTMISENVDLRTAKFKSAKETRELKRTMRDLERKNKELADELLAKHRAVPEGKSVDSADIEMIQDLEDEVAYLKERVTTYETEIETMRSENASQEFERKKMAEVVKRFGDGRGGMDVSAREEVELWKDLLESETARREQADEENRRLLDELRRLKNDNTSSITNTHAANSSHINSRRPKAQSTVSYNDSSDRGSGINGAQTAASSTLVEQLRHENSELRREIGAQTNMLKSRNKERLRLQDEIEGLKLGSRRGDGTRSIAGDSIFERSISRAQARPQSRTSGMTQMSDPEREALEFKNGELRDQNAKLRLEIHDLTTQMDQLLDEIEGLDVLKVEHQKLQQLYDNDIAEATEDLQNLSRERDEALRLQEDMEQELQDLKAEGSEKIGNLEEELDQRSQELQSLQNELSNHAEDAEALRREVRTLSEQIIRVEEEVAEKTKRIRGLQLELEELAHESDALDKDLREEKEKNTKLSVQMESGQSEIVFLREEQDGDKIKIGDLEDALNNLRNALNSEKDRAKELDTRITEERHQREAIASHEKSEVQKMMNELNRELSVSKDEARRTKKNLQSKEIEATTFKERLMELESHLKEVLGDPNGTRSTFLVAITKLQKELDATSTELENAQHHLSEKDRLLQNRDALLESHGLESKRLAELLERERQGRRTEKAQHEQWQKTHQHTSRTVTQKDSRIVELENSRQTERRKVSALEKQFNEQLSERNTLLLSLWNRISPLCGSEWQHQNSLINNHLPTLDVVANNAMLPSFSRTLLSAVSAVEGTIVSFQTRIRAIDRQMKTEYQSLEQTLDARIKKLDRLESTIQSQRIGSTFTAAPEIAKLRGENRLLKSEIASLQKELYARNSNRTSTRTTSRELPLTQTSDEAAPPPRMARHHSYAAVEHLTHVGVGPISPSRTSSIAATRPGTSDDFASEATDPSQQRFSHRLKELERRLKAEREARLLDRSSARKRLEEGVEENRRLRGELERAKDRYEADPVDAGELSPKKRAQTE